MAKNEPTFLCFLVEQASSSPIECAMFVRENGVPLALAVNEARPHDVEASKGLDRAARFVNRLLEDGVPWATLVSCSQHACRVNTPIMALVLAAAHEIAVATRLPSDPVPHADKSITAGGRDFDREC